MDNNRFFVKAALFLLSPFGLLYLYIALLITPLRNERQFLQNKNESTQARIVEDSARLQQLNAAEQAEKRRVDLDQLMEHLCQAIPHPAEVDTPPMLTKIMSKNGFTAPHTSLMAHANFPGTSDLKLCCWKTRSRTVELVDFWHVVAELENRQEMAQISDMVMKRPPFANAPMTEFVVQIPCFQ